MKSNTPKPGSPQAPEYCHTLITGVTLTGKTTAAHCIAWDEHDKKKDRRQIIVYDPVMTPTAAGTWPNGSILFNDAYKFLVYLSKFKGRAIIFIDEAQDIFSHRFVENSWIVTRGRHFGWQVVLITQRPHLVHPSARTQCGIAFMFRLSKTDARNIGQDFGHDDIQDIELDKGDFLVLVSGSKAIERANIFQTSKGIQEWTSPPDISSKRRQSS